MTIPIILLLVLVGLIAVIGLWLMASYNGLVTLRQAVKNAWAQIDVQLKRRHDLVPNLVNTVKGYVAVTLRDGALHSTGDPKRVPMPFDALFRSLAEDLGSRAIGVVLSGADSDGCLGSKAIKAEGELSSALTRLLAVSESYPELKANQNFISLQEELTSTENRVAYARQFYNDSVTRLNTQIQTFPTVVIAGMFGFKEEPFFETPGDEKEAPKVQF